MTDPTALELPEGLAGELADLDGLVSPDTGMSLAALAAQVPAELHIVELGSFRGKSTAYLAAGAAAGLGAPVHAVDPWDLEGNAPGRHGQYVDPNTREAFRAQLERLRFTDRVTAHQGFSTAVAAEWPADDWVGLLFIDAGHTYDEVKADYDAWVPYLAPDAVVVFDDIDTPKNPGVRLFVDELEQSLGVVGYRVELRPSNLAVVVPPC